MHGAGVRRVPPAEGNAHRLRGRDSRVLRQSRAQGPPVLHLLQVGHVWLSLADARYQSMLTYLLFLGLQ